MTQLNKDLVTKLQELHPDKKIDIIPRLFTFDDPPYYLIWNAIHVNSREINLGYNAARYLDYAHIGNKLGSDTFEELIRIFDENLKRLTNENKKLD